MNGSFISEACTVFFIFSNAKPDQIHTGNYSELNAKKIIFAMSLSKNQTKLKHDFVMFSTICLILGPTTIVY